MNAIVTEFVQRLKDTRESQNSLGRISYWLEKHTTINGHQFNLKGHEFQRAILDDTHFDMCVLKPSQVGLSECEARLALGFLATNPDAVCIYTLPTVHEAQRFAKSRIDPVIIGSKTLSAMLSPGSDSSSFKQLGTSQLFMIGTFGKAIISIPTDLIINDEYDFSSPEAIKTAESRLSHSRFVDSATGVRGIRKRFSTPTVPDLGVSAEYARSDRRKRLVKCKHCGEWSWPDFLTNVVVDGFDRLMEELTATEVQRLEARGLLDSARLLCPHCRGVITKQNLGPEYREWVAEFPTITTKRGYWVSPLDLPAYHTPASLMRKIADFGTEVGHYRNFTLGQPYADATNSVLEGLIETNTIINPISPDQALATGVRGCIAGLDVGKTSWFVVGKIVDGNVHVLWREQIQLRTQDGSDLEGRVLELLRSYGVVLAICDAMPYTDVILRIIARNPGVRAAEYSLRDKTLPMYLEDEKSTTVKMNRTKTLDYLVKRINSGQFKFPYGEETAIMRAHLQAIRKVERVKESGDKVSEWVSTKADHYAHALNYLNIAAHTVEQMLASNWAPAPSVRQAQVGSKYRPGVAVP